MKNIDLGSLIRWVVVIALPFLLTLITIRLLISWNAPNYPEFEYRRIAPDRYGFSDEERLELALATLEYLRRSEPADEVIYLLEDLRLPNTNEPLYNQREIGHMLDVKNLADTFLQIMWALAIVVIGGLLFLFARTSTRVYGYRAIFQGGLLTTGILLVMLILILLAWGLIFTQFHELLFPPETWTFSYSDSLIRLFPEQFWFDFGLIWAGAIFIEGLILTIVGYLLLKKTG